MPITLQSAGLLLLVSFLLAFGQILFRYGARITSPVEDFPSLLMLICQPVLICAIALYGVATIFYLIALQRVPLSVAYAFGAVGFIIVPLASAIFFSEVLTLRYAFGVGLILVGMFLTVSS